MPNIYFAFEAEWLKLFPHLHDFLKLLKPRPVMTETKIPQCKCASLINSFIWGSNEHFAI